MRLRTFVDKREREAEEKKNAEEVDRKVEVEATDAQEACAWDSLLLFLLEAGWLTGGCGVYRATGQPAEAGVGGSNFRSLHGHTQNQQEQRGRISANGQ